MRKDRRMPREMRFSKLSGAGNDFIAVDNRSGSLDRVLTRAFISGVCRRGVSVGADGLLELREGGGDGDIDFAMVYYNSDGRRASMCGNGGRCITRFAALIGVVDPASNPLVRFRSDSGRHRAEFVDGDPETVRLWMTEPTVLFLERSLAFEEAGEMTVSLVDTGVPHAVIEMPDAPGLEEHDLASTGPMVRYSQHFGHAGANVDLVTVTGESEIAMRTWERGVEAETLACGTGAVAVALALSRLGRVRLPVSVTTRSGMLLTVGMEEGGPPWLKGEARLVYDGILVDSSLS